MRARRGFTLIELLVVIGIIAIIATLAVLAIVSARARSRDAKRLADMRQVRGALEQYYFEKVGYPGPAAPAVLGTGAFRAICDSSFGFEASCAATAKTYMGFVPQDPGSGSYVYGGFNAGQTAACVSSAICPSYRINFTLEGAAGGLGKGAHTVNPNGIN
jgi:prepilin-type N-terminal cleavage/methylation domain-containing protein